MQRTHLELGDRVHDARRVRFHVSRVHLRHIPPVCSGGRRETTRQCIRKLFLRTELMIHDRPLGPECREGHIKVFAGIKVAHDHPVRDTTRPDVAAIPREGNHVRHPIQSNVPDQVLEADRIQFTRVHGLGVTANRNGQCEVANPREQIGHDGSRSDAVRDSDSFFDVTGRKHHTRDVEGVANSALQIHGLCPVSPNHLKIGKAQGSVDTGNVLHHGSRAEDGPVDLGHRTSVRLRLRENSEDHDIAEPLPASRCDHQRNSRRSQPLVNAGSRISRRRPAGQTFAGLPPRAMASQRDRRVGNDRDEDLSAPFRDLPGFINELEDHQFLEEILRALPRDREDRHASHERNRGFHSLARYTPRYVYEGRPTSARNMRAPSLALSLLLIATLLVPAATAEDFATVGKVNKLIRGQETPELAPGESGRFVFYFNSTYTEPMRNVRLNASIYRYATIDESVPVDSAWPYAYPRIAETGTKEWVWTNATVANASSRSLSFTVLTAPDSHDMPHGSIFSQSSYFVRFWLEFDGNVTGNLFRMVSPGFFTRAQWLAATIPEADPCNLPNCRGHLNVTMLAGFLGVSRLDGIIPDSAFGVKEPIPRWPFYLLIALVVFFLFLAFLFWVEENPGTFPHVETWWARTRGRIARTIAPLRPQRRPKA